MVTSYVAGGSIAPMETLAARLQWVLDSKRVASARAWCAAAELTPTHVSTYLGRWRRGEAPDMGRETLKKLADRAGVRFAWLADGEGTPDEAPGQGLELAPFDEAARFARANGAPEWAIERVRTRAARLVRDRTADDYWQMIKAAIAEGEDDASIADVGHAPAPGDIAAPRRGRK